MKQISDKDIDYATLILRVTLGIYFAVAGLAQLASWAAGYRETFTGFAIIANIGAAPSLVGILVPWIELILGVLLIFGIGTSVVAALVAFISFVFVVANGFTQGASLAKEILFVAVSLSLMLLGGGQISFDAKMKSNK